MKISKKKHGLKKTATLGSRLAFPYLVLFCWLAFLVSPIVFILWHYQMLGVQHSQLIQPQLSLKLKLNQLNNERKQLIYDVIKPIPSDTYSLNLDQQRQQLSANWQAMAYQLEQLVQFNHTHLNTQEETPRLVTLNNELLTKLKTNQLHHAQQVDERYLQVIALFKSIENSDTSRSAFEYVSESGEEQQAPSKLNPLRELTEQIVLPMTPERAQLLRAGVTGALEALASHIDNKAANTLSDLYMGEQGIFNLVTRYHQTVNDISTLLYDHQQQIENTIYLFTHKLAIDLPAPWQTIPYSESLVEWLKVDKRQIDQLLNDHALLNQFIIVCLALILLSFIGFGLHFNHRIEKATKLLLKQVKDFSKGKLSKHQKSKQPFHEANVLMSYLNTASDPQQNTWRLKEKLKTLKQNHLYVEQTANIASFSWSPQTGFIAEPHLLAMIKLTEHHFKTANQNKFKRYLDAKGFHAIREGFAALISKQKSQFSVVINWHDSIQKERQIQFLFTARLAEPQTDEIIGALRSWQDEKQKENQIQQLKNHLQQQTSRFSKRLTRYNSELNEKAHQLQSQQLVQWHQLLATQNDPHQVKEARFNAPVFDYSQLQQFNQQQVRLVAGLPSPKELPQINLASALEQFLSNLSLHYPKCQISLFVEPQLPHNIGVDINYLQELLALLLNASCDLDTEQIAIVVCEKSLKSKQQVVTIDVFWQQQTKARRWLKLLDESGFSPLNDSEHSYLKALIKQLHIKLIDNEGFNLLSHQIPLNFASGFNHREQFELPVIAELSPKLKYRSESDDKKQLILLTEHKLEANLWRASAVLSQWHIEQAANVDSLKQQLTPNVFANAPVDAIVMRPEILADVQDELQTLLGQLPKSTRPIIFVNQQGKAPQLAKYSSYSSLSLIEQPLPLINQLDTYFEQTEKRELKSNLQEDATIFQPLRASKVAINAVAIMTMSEQCRCLIAKLNALNIKITLVSNQEELNCLPSLNHFSLFLSEVPLDLAALKLKSIEQVVDNSLLKPAFVALSEQARVEPNDHFELLNYQAQQSFDELYQKISPWLYLPSQAETVLSEPAPEKETIGIENNSEFDVKALLANIALTDSADETVAALFSDKDEYHVGNAPFDLESFTQRNENSIEISSLLLDYYADKCQQAQKTLNRSIELGQIEKAKAALTTLENIARVLGAQKLRLQCQHIRTAVGQDNTALDTMLTLLNDQVYRVAHFSRVV